MADWLPVSKSVTRRDTNDGQKKKGLFFDHNKKNKVENGMSWKKMFRSLKKEKPQIFCHHTDGFSSETQSYAHKPNEQDQLVLFFPTLHLNILSSFTISPD